MAEPATKPPAKKQERIPGMEGQNDQELTELAQEVKRLEKARMELTRQEKEKREALTALMIEKGFGADDVYEDTDQVPPVVVKLKGGDLKASVEIKSDEDSGE